MRKAEKLVRVLWQSWLDNRHYGGKNDKERAFWRGYALGRRAAARQAAYALGVSDPAHPPAASAREARRDG